MKQIYFFFLLVFFCANTSFSQQTPIDFSNSAHAFSAFSNSGFSFNVDPTNSANDVGQFFNDGSENWQGFYIDLVNPIDLSSNQVITLSFYQFDPNTRNNG